MIEEEEKITKVEKDILEENKDILLEECESEIPVEESKRDARMRELKGIKDPKEKTKKKSHLGSFIFLIISISFLAFTGFFYNKYVTHIGDIPIKTLTARKSEDMIHTTKTVTIYVPNEEVTKLIPLDVVIDKGSFEEEATSIFIQLKKNSNYEIKGSDGENIPFFDDNIKLLNTYIIGDKLYLNISSDIKDVLHSKEQELLFLYTLVNSYTDIEGINRVKILINDAEVKKLKWYSLKNSYSQHLDL